MNTKTGKVDRKRTLDHAGGNGMLRSPEYEDDIALRILRTP
jgi:hypothetical protein